MNRASAGRGEQERGRWSHEAVSTATRTRRTATGEGGGPERRAALVRRAAPRQRAMARPGLPAATAEWPSRARRRRVTVIAYAVRRSRLHLDALEDWDSPRASNGRRTPKRAAPRTPAPGRATARPGRASRERARLVGL